MKRTCLVTALLLLAPVGQPLLSRSVRAQIADSDIAVERLQTTTTSALNDSTSDCPYGICHDLAGSPYQEASLADQDQSADETSEQTSAPAQPYDPYAHDSHAHQNYGYWYRHHDYDEDYAADPSSPADTEASASEAQSAYSSAQAAENATEPTDVIAETQDNTTQDNTTNEYDEYGHDEDDYGSYENEYDTYNYDDEYQTESYDDNDEYQADADYSQDDYNTDDADYGEDYSAESAASDKGDYEYDNYDNDDQYQAEEDYASDGYSDEDYANDGYNGDDAAYGEDYEAEPQGTDEGDYEYDNYQYESEYSYEAAPSAASDELTLDEQIEDGSNDDIAASDESQGYQEPYPAGDESSYGYGSELYDYDCDEAYWDDMNQEDSPAEVAEVSTTTSDMDAAVAEQHEQERELGYGYDNDPYHYAVTPDAKAQAVEAEVADEVVADEVADDRVADEIVEHLYEDAYDDIYNDSNLYGYEDDYSPTESSDGEVEAEAAKEAEVETATDPEVDQYQDLTQHGEYGDEYGWDDDAAYYDEFGYGYVPAESSSLAKRFPTVAHLIEQLATTEPVQSSLAWNRELHGRVGDLVQGVRGLQDRVHAEAVARSEDALLEDLFSDPAVEAERRVMRKMARSLDSTGSVLQGLSRRLIQMAEEGRVETATYPGWPSMER